MSDTAGTATAPADPARSRGVRTAILGGTGFVGRCIAERWPQSVPAPRFLVHRSEPAWLAHLGCDTIRVNLATGAGFAAATEDCNRLVSLLRPDGTSWLLAAIQRLLPVLLTTSISRIIHTSTIDVYGNTPVPWVDERTTPCPTGPYEREHWAVEKVVAQWGGVSSIVRPGAIFGLGGQNLVKLTEEVARGAVWRLCARRALYGARRMHLVSVENVADAIISLATATNNPPECVNVVDDSEDENNFADVQDALLRAFGRPTMNGIPHVPGIALRLLLQAQGQSPYRPARRFSDCRFRSLVLYPELPFLTRLERFARAVAGRERAA